MENEFSKEEIKNSVECKWRISHVKQTLFIYLLIVMGCSLVCFIGALNDFKTSGTYAIVWLCLVLFWGIIHTAFVLYDVAKYKYVVKKYADFKCYEVTLDTFSTSSSYKSSIYYTVTFIHNGEIKRIDTPSYFSDHFFSKFSLEEFHDKKVLGLYDENLEKFYVIKKTL